MKFKCSSGKHYYTSEKAADNCALCRRIKDGKIRQHFRRESKRLLQQEEK